MTKRQVYKIIVFQYFIKITFEKGCCIKNIRFLYNLTITFEVLYIIIHSIKYYMILSFIRCKILSMEESLSLPKFLIGK